MDGGPNSKPQRPAFVAFIVSNLVCRVFAHLRKAKLEHIHTEKFKGCGCFESSVVLASAIALPNNACSNFHACPTADISAFAAADDFMRLPSIATMEKNAISSPEEILYRKKKKYLTGKKGKGKNKQRNKQTSPRCFCGHCKEKFCDEEDKKLGKNKTNPRTRMHCIREDVNDSLSTTVT